MDQNLLNILKSMRNYVFIHPVHLKPRALITGVKSQQSE